MVYVMLNPRRQRSVDMKIPKLRDPKIEARLRLYSLPKVIRIEELRELRVDIHHMHIALLRVSDNRFVVVACLVRLDVDA
jgi:hypothetical protein